MTLNRKLEKGQEMQVEAWVDAITKMSTEDLLDVIDIPKVYEVMERVKEYSNRVASNIDSKTVASILAHEQGITPGLWCIGAINDDRANRCTMDIISRYTDELIAEDVAEHNASAIIWLPEMMQTVKLQNELLKECRRQLQIVQGYCSSWDEAPIASILKRVTAILPDSN